jgi:hypothetical protein
MSVSRESPVEDVARMRAQFDPLARRLGLDGPRVTDRTLEFEIAYFADRIGIEIQFDRRQPFPYVMIFRHSDHRSPADYRNEQGQTVKLSMLRVAEHFGIARDAQSQLRGMAGRSAEIDRMIQIACNAVEELWPLVLADHDNLFRTARV